MSERRLYSIAPLDSNNQKHFLIDHNHQHPPPESMRGCEAHTRQTANGYGRRKQNLTRVHWHRTIEEFPFPCASCKHNAIYRRKTLNKTFMLTQTDISKWFRRSVHAKEENMYWFHDRVIARSSIKGNRVERRWIDERCVLSGETTRRLEAPSPSPYLYASDIAPSDELARLGRLLYRIYSVAANDWRKCTETNSWGIQRAYNAPH